MPSRSYRIAPALSGRSRQRLSPRMGVFVFSRLLSRPHSLLCHPRLSAVMGKRELRDTTIRVQREEEERQRRAGRDGGRRLTRCHDGGDGARMCGAAAVRGDASVSLERVTNDVNSSRADQTYACACTVCTKGEVISRRMDRTPAASVSLWDADPDADNLTQVYVQEDDRLALGGAGSCVGRSCVC